MKMDVHAVIYRQEDKLRFRAVSLFNVSSMLKWLESKSANTRYPSTLKSKDTLDCFEQEQHILHSLKSNIKRPPKERPALSFL